MSTWPAVAARRLACLVRRCRCRCCAPRRLWRILSRWRSPKRRPLFVSAIIGQMGGLTMLGAQACASFYFLHERIFCSYGLAPKPLMACKYSPLGTPIGRYDEHSSKSSSVMKPRLNRTSRRKPNFRR
jgi:hypothetical protein